MKKIEAGSFQDLKSLEILYLNNNNINSLEKGVFVGLKNITNIYLGYNQITKLTRDSLLGLPDSLEVLDLRFNAPENLEAGTFVNVPKKWLSLPGNKISSIEKGSLNLPHLKVLDLTNNSLRVIGGELFDDLGNLENLSLDPNAITKIEKGATKNLKLLRFMLIDKNGIKILENGAFFGLTNPIIIWGYDLPIEVIQCGLFANV